MRFWKSPNAARLTCQDTSLNPSTKDKKQPCDTGLYSIYNRNTDCPDAHSATGKMVFVDSVNGQLYIYKMDDDSEIKLYQNTKIPNTNKESQELQIGDSLEDKIIKSISHRAMTTKEFKSFTKDAYIDKYNDRRFANWRRVSKTINFGVLFNCSAPTLAQQLEDAGYTFDEAIEFMELTNNLPFYNQLLLKNNKMKGEKVAFLAAATLMLENYYKGFPGVPERTQREAKFAWKNGYSRCWHGPVRHLPELRYMKRNREGQVIGADQRLFSSMVSNRINQAGNSPIQCMEMRIAGATISEVYDYIEEWNLKSHLYNMVHDSEDWVIYKPEVDLVCSLINACSTWIREPYYDIDMCMDFTLNSPMKGYVNNIYHGGQENPFKIKPIDEAVDEWNKAHLNQPGFIPIKWHGCKI